MPRSRHRSTERCCAALADVVDDATDAFESFDYARALERSERFFWSFCDDYLELVKQRVYGVDGDVGAASARRALELALSTLLRLFAPHLPFVTEEVWSWWQDGSIHRSAWPDSATLRDAAPDGAPIVYEAAAAVLGAIRKEKTTRQKSLRTEVQLAVIRDAGDRLEALRAAIDDVKQAGRVHDYELVPSDSLSVEVKLADTDDV